MIKSIKILFLFLFTYIIGQIILLFSLFYLNMNNIYIFEENVFSHWNNSLIYFLPFFLINIIVFFLFSVNFNKNKIIQNSIKMKKSTFYLLILFVIIILILLFINLLISETPPLLQSGYISRFDYLENTKLWFFLKIFGSPVAIIPIILGFIFLQNKKYAFIKNNLYIYILVLLYFTYVILIGQKFGAIQLGVLFLIIPMATHKILNNQVIITFKIFLYSFVLSISVIFLIIHHYSNLSIVKEFGTPLEFIAYRIFALQGHTFWGTIENLEHFNSDLTFWWDGMHNTMRVIGLPGIENAIKRGVNFTAGYPVILIVVFPISLTYIVFFILTFLYFYFIKLWIYNLYNINYIIYAYLSLYIGAFVGHGSLKYLLNFKIFILLFILLSIYFITIKFKKGKNK